MAITKEEFINIYFTGTKNHIREAIIEMNEEHSMSEIARILGTDFNNLRNECRYLKIQANKKSSNRRKKKGS